MFIWIITVAKIEGNEEKSGNGRMEIVNAWPTDGGFAKDAGDGIREDWGQLDINTECCREECILFMIGPICDKMAKCGHIPGKCHSLEDTGSQKPEQNDQK